MTALLGVGLVGSGKKVYEPKVTQNARGDEVTTAVENTDYVEQQYDEEAVCNFFEGHADAILQLTNEFMMNEERCVKC